MQVSNLKKLNSGISLIEIMLVLFIIATVVFGIAKLSISNTKSTITANNQKLINLAVQSILQRISANLVLVNSNYGAGNYSESGGYSDHQTAPLVSCDGSTICSQVQQAEFDLYKWKQYLVTLKISNLKATVCLDNASHPGVPTQSNPNCNLTTGNNVYIKMVWDNHLAGVPAENELKNYLIVPVVTTPDVALVGNWVTDSSSGVSAHSMAELLLNNAYWSTNWGGWNSNTQSLYLDNYCNSSDNCDLSPIFGDCGSSSGCSNSVVFGMCYGNSSSCSGSVMYDHCDSVNCSNSIIYNNCNSSASCKNSIIIGQCNGGDCSGAVVVGNCSGVSCKGAIVYGACNASDCTGAVVYGNCTSAKCNGAYVTGSCPSGTCSGTSSLIAQLQTSLQVTITTSKGKPILITKSEPNNFLVDSVLITSNGCNNNMTCNNTVLQKCSNNAICNNSTINDSCENNATCNNSVVNGDCRNNATCNNSIIKGNCQNAECKTSQIYGQCSSGSNCNGSTCWNQYGKINC